MSFKFEQFNVGTTSQKMGSVVAMDNNYLVSSGYENSDVRIYRRGDNGWEMVKFLNLPAPYEFGYDLKIRKGKLFISTHSVTRIVTVYEDSNNFSSIGTILVQSVSLADGFGSSFSVEDSFAVVGSPLRGSVSSPSSYTNHGAIYIYDKDTDISWFGQGNVPQDYVIYPDDSVSNQYFGGAVDSFNSTIVVGARGDNESKGAVYVFDKNEESGIFEQTQKIIAPDGEIGDEFGCDVSIFEDYLAVGAEFYDSSDTDINVGAVYIYKNISGQWNFLKKIVSVDESGLISNNFGHSIHLNGDYLIVGSPNAQNSGVADVFYRKRNWGHLVKIDYNSTSVGDLFGSSVAIDYPYLAVGAPGYTTGSDEGITYIYNDPPIRLRSAQEFEANGDFLPTKASVYLKRSGKNIRDYWLLTDSSPIVLDSTNFSSLSKSNNFIWFDDEFYNFTGNGYMHVPINSLTSDDFSILNYPIRSQTPMSYNVWLRCYINSDEPSLSNFFNADILLDGVVIKNIYEYSASDEWFWVNFNIVLPDTQKHILGIRMKDVGLALDKIYIDADKDFIPEGFGKGYTESPYVTVHFKLYDGQNLGYPHNPLKVYDFKTTLDELIQDDWYNFKMDIFEDDYIITEYGEAILDGNYFVVISSTGGNSNNFAIWERIDSDEYLPFNACFRMTDNGSNNGFENGQITNRFCYNAKSGNQDIESDIWYIDNTKSYAFKIYSDYDPIEDI